MTMDQRIEVRQINITKEPELYAQILELRNIELRKEIGLNIYDEDLSDEINQVILAALLLPTSNTTTIVLGCAVLAAQDDQKTFRLRQMCVHNGYQGQNIGRRIMEAVEVVAKDQLRSRIHLLARTVSKGFYTKLGYSTISDEFLEKCTKVMHFEMEKLLV